MMRDSSRQRDKEIGVIQALLMRLNEQRMPYALKLKGRVDRGERLTEYDIRFLRAVQEEGAQVRRLAAKHPKYQEVVNEMTSLYAEIMRKGAENERGAPGGDSAH